MYCPHNLIACNKLFFIKIHTSGDYNYKHQIPKKEWFQLWRYELGLFQKPIGGYKLYINKSKSIYG